MAIGTPKKQQSANSLRNPHSIQTNAGNLTFQEDVGIDETVGLKRDGSFVTLDHAGGGYLKMFHGGTKIFSPGELEINSDANVKITAKGNKQEIITGDNILYVHGNNIVLEGKQDKEQRDAAKKLAQIYEKIEKSKQDAIKSTEGDDVECPICAETYLENKTEGFLSRLFSTLDKYCGAYFGYALAALQSLLNTLFAAKLDETSGQAILEGTCGNKGCKNGKIKSPQKKLEAGNKAAEETYKGNQEEIEKLANLMQSSSTGRVINGDVSLTIGLPELDSGQKPYVQTGVHPLSVKHGGDGKRIFVKSGEGASLPIISYTNPHPPIKGNATFTVVGKLLVKAGICGFELLASGRGHICSGDLKLVASEGEALLTSNNLTTVKGKIVRIDGNDGSGTGGIILDAKHTRAAGGFHVDGNLTTLGGVSVDGNLACPFLIAPSMRSDTTKSGSTKFVGNSGEWNVTNIATTTADTVLQQINYYIMPGNLIDIGAIFKLIFELFDVIRKAVTIEPNTTGFAWLGPIPLPVTNFTHSHTKTPEDHTHTATIPKGNLYNDRESWAGARPGASSVPTPANVHGDGSSPGPNSSGGACGGGGYLYNSPSSKASKARRRRNQSFGLNTDDAFGDYDFVNVTPLSGDFYYDPNDGSIQPEDKVIPSIGLDCPPDLFDNPEDDKPEDEKRPNDNSVIRDC